MRAERRARRPREVAVELGLVDERSTEIRGGLAPDDAVVVGYR